MRGLRVCLHIREQFAWGHDHSQLCCDSVDLIPDAANFPKQINNFVMFGGNILKQRNKSWSRLKMDFNAFSIQQADLIKRISR